jgi:hypothetical protein
MLLKPVRLPLGRARLATRPTPTGSPTKTKMIGIVEVAFFAASVPGVPLAVVMPSRPGEFLPEPLTDPDLTLSRHPARATNRRLPPSVENWSSSCCQLARSRPQ